MTDDQPEPFAASVGAWFDSNFAITMNTDALPLDTGPDQFFTVRKISHLVQVSEELLHPERYPPPRITRWQRLHWRWHDYRRRLTTAWEVLRDGHDCGDYL